MGGPESRASAFRPASTTARSSAGRLITVAQTNKARLERLGRRAVAVEVAAVIGVHEDVGAALQLGIDPARRLEPLVRNHPANDLTAYDLNLRGYAMVLSSAARFPYRG